MFHEMYIRHRPSMPGIFNNIRTGLVKQVTDMWHRKQQYLLTRTEISIVNSVYCIGCMRRQLSRDMSADASFLFDIAAVLRETITETLCPSLMKVHVQLLSLLSEIYFCADKYNFSRR